MTMPTHAHTPRAADGKHNNADVNSTLQLLFPVPYRSLGPFKHSCSVLNRAQQSKALTQSIWGGGMQLWLPPSRPYSGVHAQQQGGGAESPYGLRLASWTAAQVLSACVGAEYGHCTL
jgi:hypothetical protein